MKKAIIASILLLVLYLCACKRHIGPKPLEIDPADYTQTPGIMLTITQTIAMYFTTTNTPTSTPIIYTPTGTFTPVNTVTNTASVAVTSTNTYMIIPTSTNTPANSATSTNTIFPSFTRTFTNTPVPPTNTSTWTATSTPDIFSTPTNTQTQIPTPTPTITNGAIIIGSVYHSSLSGPDICNCSYGHPAYGYTVSLSPVGWMTTTGYPGNPLPQNFTFSGLPSGTYAANGVSITVTAPGTYYLSPWCQIAYPNLCSGSTPIVTPMTPTYTPTYTFTPTPTPTP